MAYGEQCCGRDRRPLLANCWCGLRFLAICRKAKRRSSRRTPRGCARRQRRSHADWREPARFEATEGKAPRLSAQHLVGAAARHQALLLMLALLAMFNTSSAVALSILVVLPAAFRIWIVVLPTKPSPDEADRARARQGFAAEKQHALFARTRAPSWRLETARRTRADPGLEVASQIGGGFLRPPLETERRNEAALLVHQINQRGVIHTVLAVVGRNLLGVDAIGFLHRVD